MELANRARIHRGRHQIISGAAQHFFEQIDVGFVIVDDQNFTVVNVFCGDHESCRSFSSPDNELYFAEEKKTMGNNTRWPW